MNNECPLCGHHGDGTVCPHDGHDMVPAPALEPCKVQPIPRDRLDYMIRAARAAWAIEDARGLQ